MTPASSAREALIQAGIETVYHVTPLHYVPLIISNGALESKTRLIAAGHDELHFRRSSHRRDTKSGFGGFVHLMNVPNFPLLCDKLQRSLPHVRFALATKRLPEDLWVCRYNIAKHRISPDRFAEGPSSGYLQPGVGVPVASTPDQISSLIALRRGSWVEVLVRDRVLIADAEIACFSEEEVDAVRRLLQRQKMELTVTLDRSSGYQPRHPNAALEFVEAVAHGARDPSATPPLAFD